MADNGEVQGREVLPAAAAVLIKGDIQLPVKVVLDAPMGTRSGEDQSRVSRKELM